MRFECNLPKEIPEYYHYEIRDRLKETVDRVYMRTEKLNEAMDITKLSFGTFHRLAKEVFDWYSDPEKGNNVELFDQMSPKKLAREVKSRYTKKEFPDFIEFPNTIVLYDTAFVSTKDWELLRHFGIGGSDSSVLMGLSHYNTLEGLYYDKVGFPVVLDDKSKNQVFKRGHFMEDTVIDSFCKMTGATRIPESRMFRSVKYPNTIANPDAILLMPSGELVIGEAKTAVDVYNKMVEWRNGAVPANYVTQTTQYLGVMNDPRLTKCWIICLPVQDQSLGGEYIGSEITSDIRRQEIPRDEAFEEEIMQAEEKFWKTYVEQNVKPEPSMNSELDKTVRLRFVPSPISNPEAPKRVLSFEQYNSLIEKFKKADEALEAANKLQKEAKNTRDSLKNQILEAMEDSQEADVRDASGQVHYVIKNKVSNTDYVKTKDLKLAFPEIFERFGYTTSKMLFSVKPVIAKKK